MNNSTLGDPLERYAAINGLLLKTHKQTCLDASYDDYITSMKKTAWTSSAAEGGLF